MYLVVLPGVKVTLYAHFVRFVSAELSFVKLKYAWLLLRDEFETLSAEIIELFLGRRIHS